jgi:hypothetical protein
MSPPQRANQRAQQITQPSDSKVPAIFLDQNLIAAQIKDEADLDVQATSAF